MLRLATVLICLATPLAAQPTDFTTPEGAAFMHQQLGGAMIGFKEDGEEDMIYFTNLLAWRCGVQEVHYGLNDDAIVTQFPLEPCYRDLQQPNTMKEIGTTYPFFLRVPKASAQQIRLRIVYEDGNTATITSERVAHLVN